ncbi:LLM class flavin-dependent oxidoreductase [Paraburkholderia susongensis]|uniref:Flavin-dependent oxidoreductase, luciferase family (Includes alkanesulfonate monooxygenase SsuD and methylene tetrahydromethanopterin reductase) n=1 Tax=Paraburkholderia susongensis TaxID=1515439 RepID=A0A1X7JFM5_9BURK|nr:LLM class flavin-dependent oxidoreductase [Paraburkholderia susongensis]SMG26334.1 Flavin-dependent oxidoreductase, luciferase family (includes alkanesulfonate monooxygenase SsuD and methylene tetrahydromethanopterin reductase) [Paraburkholderia susongensis]
MHFGLFCLMTQRDRQRGPSQIYRDTTEQVKLVEQAGFEIAWFAEHHFSNYCLCPSPLTMTTYMAGQTERIKLGPAVIVAPLYEPIRLLEDIGMADQISNGRLVLGFGTGYQEYEFQKFGVELSTGRARMLELLDFVEAYLDGEPLSFNGEHIHFSETYFSVRTMQPRPAIYVAGLAGDMETQRRAVQRGYIPFFTTGWNRLDVLSGIRDKVESAYVAAGGDAARMPFALQRYVFVTDDAKEAELAADGARYVRRVAMSMRNKYARLDGAFLEELPAPDEPPLDEIIDRLLIGSPEVVAEKLVREIETLRPTHISCFMAIPGVSQPRILRSIERFGAEVMPLLGKYLHADAACGRQ